MDKADKLYLHGVGIAGKYIPYIANKIYEYNKATSNELIRLEGIIIGNGMVNPKLISSNLGLFAFSLGLLDY